MTERPILFQGAMVRVVPGSIEDYIVKTDSKQDDDQDPALSGNFDER
jgi:hypothetical protein